MSELTNGEQFLVNALAESVGRQRMLYASQFNGNTKRTKLWDEFGYPDSVPFDLLYRAYRRNSAAYSGVHKTLDSCWVDMPTIIEGPESDEAAQNTPWEVMVTRLMKRFWAKIKDADRRNLVGRYSAILLQIKDGNTWDKPVDVATVRRLGEKAIVRMIPAWESQIKPASYDIDTLSDTYGQPTEYQFNEQPIDGGGYFIVKRFPIIKPGAAIYF